ncbi:hypothetical protein DFP72DRAFT_942620 [Ephemerocybe angulata]|uniref:G domain-containing protein n=1 Tax=Ephemerocybe angulata TaxID=980116 RepID=A0A8H6H8S8_9AGAR|nr:hypothetical protein DFP72DRAFT_942620 [Tulosesus angulatus]
MASPVLNHSAAHVGEDVGPIVSAAAGCKKSLPPIPVPSPSPSVRNLVFFGETGVGKSSIINMVRESMGISPNSSEGMAKISSSAMGCTVVNTVYSLHVSPSDSETLSLALWDTAGFSETAHGTVSSDQAGENLVTLLQSMGGGTDLLVYCVRGRPFRSVVGQIYDLAHKKACGGKVPILLVVNGLENQEKGMEDWWVQNKAIFVKRKMDFDGHACITSTRGKLSKNQAGSSEKSSHIYDEQYEDSLGIIREAIITTLLAQKPRDSSILRNILNRLKQFVYEAVPGRKHRSQLDDGEVEREQGRRSAGRSHSRRNTN